MAKYLLNLGGLTSSLKLQQTNGGTISLQLSLSLTPGPINVIQMGLTLSLTANNSNLIVALSGETKNKLKVQYNKVSFGHLIYASQSQDDNLSLLENISHGVIFGTSVHKVTEIEMSHGLGMSQVPANAIMNNFTLAQIIEYTTGLSFENALILTQSLTYKVELLRTLDSGIIISQGVTGFKLSGNNRIVPIGVSADCIDITSTRADNFEIVELDSLDSVIMKHPDIGDTIIVDHLTVDLSSRGLIDLSFVPPLRSKFVIRDLPFRAISTAKKNEYQSFIKTYLGKKMSIITPEGNTVVGYVINPEGTYTDNSKVKIDCPNGSGSWDFNIRFLIEGILNV